MARVFISCGNVWGWVADWYDADYYTSLPENVVNPTGPVTGSRRVLRGGTFDFILNVWAAYRNSLAPTSHGGLYGFRVVCPATES